MEKIITVLNKDYKVVFDSDEDQGCHGCAFHNEVGCVTASDIISCSDLGITFQLVNTEKPEHIVPKIKIDLELDMTQAILPTFFTVKGLKVQSLDTALKNQSDAYNISVKALPQETLEVLAEELKAEFIRRNTKVAV